MKKEEALKIAPERARLLCEYIIQILYDNRKINGDIQIDSARINSERILTLNITVPSRGFFQIS